MSSVSISGNATIWSFLAAVLSPGVFVVMAGSMRAILISFKLNVVRYVSDLIALFYPSLFVCIIIIHERIWEDLRVHTPPTNVLWL